MKQSNHFTLNQAGTQKLSQRGLVNDTKVTINVDGKASHFKYGGAISLNADTSQSRKKSAYTGNYTMMFVESSMGRLQVGDYYGVAEMYATGSNLGAGPGGLANWADWFNYFNYYAVGSGAHLISPGMPTSVDGQFSLLSTKASYITPQFGTKQHNVQFGVTYIPDSDQHGTVSNLKSLAKSYSSNSYYGGAPAGQPFGYRDVLQGIIVYTAKLGELNLKTSLSSEVGSAKKLYNVEGLNETVIRHDLKAYHIGMQVNYKGLTIGTSYGNWMKPGLYKTIITSGGASQAVSNAKSGYYWDLGARYDYNAMSMSVGYITARNGGFTGTAAAPTIASSAYSPTRCKDDVYAFSFDYKLAPGFRPYVEAVLPNLRDKSQTSPTSKNKGSVFLVGSFINF
jgi:hypothetical protein